MPEESRYRRIARDLRKRIQDGDLAPGDRLPSEKELEDEFDASRNTIRLALGTLRNQGLVESRAGRGTFVQQIIPITFHASRATRRPYEAPYDSTDIEDVEDVEFAELGGQARSFAELLIQNATPEVASRLRVDEDSMVVVRRTFRYVDDRSASVETSYYPMDIAQNTQLMIPEDIGRGALHVLNELGFTQVGYVDELRSRMPTPDEANQLELPPGVPVMELYRTGFAKDRAIRLSWTVFAGNGIRFQYEIGDLSRYHAE